MKTRILFNTIIIIACIHPLLVCAQLEVNTSGNVYVSKNLQVEKNLAIKTDLDTRAALNISYVTPGGGAQPYYGVKSLVNMRNSMPTSPIYGVYGAAKANLCQYMVASYPMAGVFGYAEKPLGNMGATVFSAGVAGVTHSYSGIGVYGGIRGGNNLPTSMDSNAKYAGYFDGTVYANGTVMAATISTLSSLSNVENVQSISTPLTEYINMLKPVSYRLKQDSVWIFDENAKELQGLHYGLIAQDVQKILPEIVYERGGNLSINYIELIPLLIKEVQDLSAEVEALKSTSKSQKANASYKEDSQTVLHQNAPNPFNKTTTIGYYLPTNTRNAAIHVYDMNGTELSVFPLTTFGQGELTIDGGTLRAGMYLYSLIANEQLVDTKRMVLTE